MIAPSAPAPVPRLAFETLYDGAMLTALRARPAEGVVAGPLLVVFGSFRGKGGKPEFVGTAARLGRPALFVMEHDFGFYATPERVARIVPMIEAEMAATGSAAVDTLGFSVGAFGALAYAERLPVRHAMAFAPRFSPDPAIVRDARVRRKMEIWSGHLTMPTVEAGLRQLRSAVILHGLRGPDRVHLPHFPRLDHVEHRIVPGERHFVADWARRRGLLGPLVAAALAGDRAEAARLLAGAGAIDLHGTPGRLLLGTFGTLAGARTLVRRLQAS